MSVSRRVWSRRSLRTSIRSCFLISARLVGKSASFDAPLLVAQAISLGVADRYRASDFSAWLRDGWRGGQFEGGTAFAHSVLFKSGRVLTWKGVLVPSLGSDSSDRLFFDLFWVMTLVMAVVLFPSLVINEWTVGKAGAGCGLRDFFSWGNAPVSARSQTWKDKRVVLDFEQACYGSPTVLCAERARVAADLGWRRGIPRLGAASVGSVGGFRFEFRMNRSFGKRESHRNAPG